MPRPSSYLLRTGVRSRRESVQQYQHPCNKRGTGACAWCSSLNAAMLVRYAWREFPNTAIDLHSLHPRERGFKARSESIRKPVYCQCIPCCPLYLSSSLRKEPAISTSLIDFFWHTISGITIITMGNAEERHGGVSLFPLQQRDRPRARVLRLIATSLVLFAATSFYYLTSFYGRASRDNAFDIAKQCTINNLHSNLSFLDPAVPIAADEFLERRDRLARALVESKVDAFVLEPGYTFQ